MGEYRSHVSCIRLSVIYSRFDLELEDCSSGCLDEEDEELDEEPDLFFAALPPSNQRAYQVFAFCH